LKDDDSEKINKGKTRSTSASPSAASSSITSINNNNMDPTTTKRCSTNDALSDLTDRNHKSASKILGQNM
jgi:hypothetical protein